MAFKLRAFAGMFVTSLGMREGEGASDTEFLLCLCDLATRGRRQVAWDTVLNR